MFGVCRWSTHAPPQARSRAWVPSPATQPLLLALLLASLPLVFVVGVWHQVMGCAVCVDGFFVSHTLPVCAGQTVKFWVFLVLVGILSIMF